MAATTTSRLSRRWQCWSAEPAEFDSFDINADWKIDSVPVTPVPAGIEGLLSLGGIGDNPVPAAPVGPIGASIPPQPNNAVTDLSGWGPLGKMHPRLLAKDRMVSAYHNRMLDPRYRHLKGYGHQALAPPRSPEKTGQPSLGHRLAGFF
ncbi:hypothetical protein TYRP_005155 [Tyrophagus putrescentiae]|nr:hypothetical protein TYRP_005155 [Tyrophagus putrescentiae]